MATYKVLQDIEAEDKFLGPLTLKQFIFAAIAIVSLYLCFIFLTKGVWVLVFPFVPVIFVTGFLAFPWGRDQPTEVWLLAKIRFFFKPRKRIWDQAGLQELVKITAPKVLEKVLVNDLNQGEVRSRLKALADTIDSRGWAVKNVNVNMFAQPAYGTVAAGTTDRLIDLSALPQQVSNLDLGTADDMFTSPLASQVAAQIAQSDQDHRSQAVQNMQQAVQQDTTQATPDAPAPDYWFMNEQPAKTEKGLTTFGTTKTQPNVATDDYLPPAFRKAGDPDEEDQAVLEEIHRKKEIESHSSYSNHRRIEPYHPERHPPKTFSAPPVQPMTATPAPDILNLAINNDRNVASLAREANANHPDKPDDEVVISLH